jgi:hypothetical protein
MYAIPRLRNWVFDRSAQKSEEMAFKQRQGVVHSDTWLKEHLGFAGEEF